MNKKMCFFLLSFIFTNTSYSTVYVFGHESRTGEYGAIVLTSGPIDKNNRIIDARKGIGLFGWGGGSIVGDISYRHNVVGPAYQMIESNESNEEIQSYVLNNYGRSWQGQGTRHYRLGFISPKNGIGIVFPPPPARPEGEDTFELDEKNGAFVMMGGALEIDVLKVTKAYTARVFSEKALPLVCKLLMSGINIVKNGGEVTDIISAQVIVDSPRLNDLFRVNIFYDENLSELEILNELPKRIEAQGYKCFL